MCAYIGAGLSVGGVQFRSKFKHIKMIFHAINGCLEFFERFNQKERIYNDE